MVREVDVVRYQHVDPIARKYKSADAGYLIDAYGHHAHALRQGGGKEIRVLFIGEPAHHQRLALGERRARHHLQQRARFAGIRLDHIVELQMFRPGLDVKHILFEDRADGNVLLGDIYIDGGNFFIYRLGLRYRNSLIAVLRRHKVHGEKEGAGCQRNRSKHDNQAHR